MKTTKPKRQSADDAFRDLAIQFGCDLDLRVKLLRSARERGWDAWNHGCRHLFTEREDAAYQAGRTARHAYLAAVSCGRGEIFRSALKCCFTKTSIAKAA